MSTTVFESVAKTNTTHTERLGHGRIQLFESVAKTNTTHTLTGYIISLFSLRVLLKQIQPTQSRLFKKLGGCLRVLLKQIQPTPY